MLSVSTVYLCWKNNDFCDAYLPDNGAQVIFIQRIEAARYMIWFVENGLFGATVFQGIAKSSMKLWIDEGIEGIAA